MCDFPACVHYLKFLLHKGKINPFECRGTAISYLSIFLFFFTLAMYSVSIYVQGLLALTD